MIDVDMLRDKQLFFGLSDDQLSRIAGVAEQREYNAGESLFREGERGDSLFVIVSGEIDLFKTKDDGSRLRLSALGPGTVLGEMSLVNIEPRSATAQASVPVVAVLMNNVRLSGVFRDDRELFIVMLMNITRILSKRLREASTKLS